MIGIEGPGIEPETQGENLESREEVWDSGRWRPQQEAEFTEGSDVERVLHPIYGSLSWNEKECPEAMFLSHASVSLLTN